MAADYQEKIAALEVELHKIQQQFAAVSLAQPTAPQTMPEEQPTSQPEEQAKKSTELNPVLKPRTQSPSTRSSGSSGSSGPSASNSQPGVQESQHLQLQRYQPREKVAINIRKCFINFKFVALFYSYMFMYITRNIRLKNLLQHDDGRRAATAAGVDKGVDETEQRYITQNIILILENNIQV